MGDTALYGELLDELYAELRDYVSRTVPTNAEDVLQEILITVHKFRHTYDPSRPFLPWLYAIAKHRIQDNRRSDWRAARRADALARSIASGGQSDAAAVRDVRDALEELPEKQRTVISLLKLQGYSVKEISKRLSMSVGAVKVTAHRGYEMLRRKLTESPDEV